MVFFSILLIAAASYIFFYSNSMYISVLYRKMYNIARATMYSNILNTNWHPFQLVDMDRCLRLVHGPFPLLLLPLSDFLCSYLCHNRHCQSWNDLQGEEKKENMEKKLYNHHAT